MKLPMQKCIVNIHLMKMPIMHYCQSKQNLNCGHFSHWEESVKVVQFFNLNIALCYKPSLVMFNAPIRCSFNFEYPFVANGYSFWWKVNNLLSLILLMCFDLSLHCLTPALMFDSLSIRSRFKFLGQTERKRLVGSG